MVIDHFERNPRLVVSIFRDFGHKELNLMVNFGFVFGFFLDALEILLLVVPIAIPSLIAMGADPIWLAVMLAISVQTSFLMPPSGFALFFLRSVAPPELTIADIYRGAPPFIAIQLIVLGLLVAFPMLATWLPKG